MDWSPPGSSVHGILQPRILEWVAISSSRGSPDLGVEPASPALTGRFFTTQATWELAECLLCARHYASCGCQPLYLPKSIPHLWEGAIIFCRVSEKIKWKKRTKCYRSYSGFDSHVCKGLSYWLHKVLWGDAPSTSFIFWHSSIWPAHWGKQKGYSGQEASSKLMQDSSNPGQFSLAWLIICWRSTLWFIGHSVASLISV